MTIAKFLTFKNLKRLRWCCQNYTSILCFQGGQNFKKLRNFFSSENFVELFCQLHLVIFLESRAFQYTLTFASQAEKLERFSLATISNLS